MTLDVGVVRLSESECAALFQVFSHFTGQRPEGSYFRVIQAAIERRMRETGCATFDDYCRKAAQESEEKARMLSAMAIHTTSWFRELPHFTLVEKELLLRSGAPSDLRLLVTACSTGEEAYSFACLLEAHRISQPSFEYRVTAFDLDPISVATAVTGRYSQQATLGVPPRFANFIEPKAPDQRGVCAPIAERCQFSPGSLMTLDKYAEGSYHLVTCRNVLIYFSLEKVREIVRALKNLVAYDGLLVLGHSDVVELDWQGMNLQPIGNNVYRRMKQLSPGTTKLASPFPLRAPDAPGTARVGQSKTRSVVRFPEGELFDVVVVGSSTGGPEALQLALKNLPHGFPPVLVVQHIQSHYAASLARRTAQSANLIFSEALDGSRLLPGHLYMVTTDAHLTVSGPAGACRIRVNHEEKRHSQRPAIDCLFESLAKPSLGLRVLALLLTGMGVDGVEGMAALHANPRNINLAQDEASCVVFGMPKAAMDRGVVHYQGTPEAINHALCLVAASGPRKI